MASRKISELTALTAPASADVLPIVDVSEALPENQNKKITYAELLSSAPAGTAAAPSFAFDGDPDSGVYSAGANQLALATGGSERLRITSAGLVGIGTSSPSSTNSGLDIASGGLSLVLGADGSASTRTNVTNKQARIGAYHYTNVEEPVGVATVFSTASSNAIYFGGGTASVNAATSLEFYTAANTTTTTGTQRMVIDSSGRVGIGTTSPTAPLQVLNAGTGNNTNNGAINLCRTATVGSTLYHMYSTAVSDEAFAFSVHGGTTFSDTTYTKYLASAGGVHIWYGATNATERARIDSSGRLLVGTSSARANFSGTDTPQFQVEGNSFNTSTISVVAAQSTGGGNIELGSTGGTTVGGTGTVTTNSYLGSIHFLGGNGTNLLKAAAIDCQVDGTVSGGGANDMPGRLVFSTTADGASSPTERMRITQAGTILVGKTANDQTSAGMQLLAGGRASFATNGIECIYVNRNTDDGNLIELAQAGTIEGTISVSGTTVSYNGAHLSRWSQLPSGAERAEIPRGTVLSNIDEMCEWGEEDNEQLNRMKVSDVEGDKNVAGVFQAWDDDDDTYTNDFYCAMTGDFIIRIGAGVTVERGDLLMSAGDGTAKPQDDDIIRSKTIAKVTSTNVSCTYEDGSYCVPCVLMAC